MPKLETTVLATTEVEIAPRLRAQLVQSLHTYQELQAKMAHLKSEIDAAKEAIEDIRDIVGEEKISISGFSIARVQGTSKRLDHKLLVSLGCAAAWIAEATTEKPNRAYTKVTCPGEREENEHA